MVYLRGGDVEFFHIVAGILKGDIWALYLFIIITQPLRSGRI